MSELYVPSHLAQSASNPSVSVGRVWEHPTWSKAAPKEWEHRLRLISPIVEKTSHLRFRWHEVYDQWVLYECTPAPLLTEERIAQLTTHWTDLPKDQQIGRKAFVSDYQHYMWRTHRVDARPFWILQGPIGGTPAKYTDREAKILRALGLPDEPPSPGDMPACPFSMLSMQAIQARDRLVQYGNSVDALLASNDPGRIASEDRETERQFRAAFLDWFYETMQPMAAFMTWYTRQSESDQTLRRATREEANAASVWKDHFIETGELVTPSHAQVSTHPASISVPTSIS